MFREIFPKWEDNWAKHFPPCPPSTTAPLGHFESEGRRLGQIVDDKRRRYGRAVAHAERSLLSLYPTGIPVDAYWKIALIVRMEDKLSRLATDTADDDEDPWADLVGYALIGADERRAHRAQGEPEDAADSV